MAKLLGMTATQRVLSVFEFSYGISKTNFKAFFVTMENFSLPKKPVGTGKQ